MAKLPPIPTISLDEMWRDLQGRALDLDVVNRLGVGAFHAPGGDPMKTLSTLLAIFRHLPPAEAVLDGMPGKVPSHWWDLDCVEVEVDSAAIFKLGNGREIRATEIKWDREAWNLVFRAPPPFSEQQFDQGATQEQRSGMSPDVAPDGGTAPPATPIDDPVDSDPHRPDPLKALQDANVAIRELIDFAPSLLKNVVTAAPPRRRGPRPGTLKRYEEQDRELFPALEKVKDIDHLSVHAAAQKLADEGRVSGTGTPKSRAKRLASLYLTDKFTETR